MVHLISTLDTQKIPLKNKQYSMNFYKGAKRKIREKYNWLMVQKKGMNKDLKKGIANAIVSSCPITDILAILHGASNFIIGSMLPYFLEGSWKKLGGNLKKK